MKIGFFEIESWEKDFLSSFFPKDQLFFFRGKLTFSNARKFKDLEAISVFIYSEINSKLLENLPRLKMIATRSTGYDHIDLAECKKRNITVCNVPTYGENTVAEHTFALILALSRKIVDCVERTKKGSFDLEGLKGFDLREKILGVIGTGNIGKHIIRIGNGFEMKVIAFDAFPNKDLPKQLGFEYVSMDKLLADSDIVTIHVPYNKFTHHLIDKKAIAKMKKSAYLINTSRGGIIETDALVKALKAKKIAGAGLDVLEEECNIIEEPQLLKKSFPGKCDLKTLVENHMLLEMLNVIVTPHNEFNTQEALIRILKVTVENIQEFKKGNKINFVR